MAARTCAFCGLEIVVLFDASGEFLTGATHSDPKCEEFNSNTPLAYLRLHIDRMDQDNEKIRAETLAIKKGNERLFAEVAALEARAAELDAEAAAFKAQTAVEIAVLEAETAAFKAETVAKEAEIAVLEAEAKRLSEEQDLLLTQLHERAVKRGKLS